MLWPPHRTAEYCVWRACERFGIKPTGVKDSWDDCDVWTQAKLIAYDQTRSHEEFDAAKLGVKI